MINFYNGNDAAVSIWEFSNLSKPDFLGGRDWGYGYNIQCGGAERCPMPVEGGDSLVKDVFTKGVNWTGLLFPSEIYWHPNATSNSELADNDDILAHIIPPRTRGLARVNGIGSGSVVIDSVNLASSVIDPTNDIYTSSNQALSAQFYGDYIKRKAYWESVMNQFGLSKISSGP